MRRKRGVRVDARSSHRSLRRDPNIHLGLRGQQVANSALDSDHLSETGVQCVSLGISAVHQGYFLRGQNILSGRECGLLIGIALDGSILVRRHMALPDNCFGTPERSHSGQTLAETAARMAGLALRLPRWSMDQDSTTGARFPRVAADAAVCTPTFGHARNTGWCLYEGSRRKRPGGWRPPPRVQRGRASRMGSFPCQRGLSECARTAAKQSQSPAFDGLRELCLDGRHAPLDGGRVARNSNCTGPHDSVTRALLVLESRDVARFRTRRHCFGGRSIASRLGAGGIATTWWRWVGHLSLGTP